MTCLSFARLPCILSQSLHHTTSCPMVGWGRTLHNAHCIEYLPCCSAPAMHGMLFVQQTFSGGIAHARCGHADGAEAGRPWQLCRARWAAVERSNEGNTAQLAQLQVAMASLQSQRLDLQRANLSGRLSVLQDIAAHASLNAAAKVCTYPLPKIPTSISWALTHAAQEAAAQAPCEVAQVCNPIR